MRRQRPLQAPLRPGRAAGVMLIFLSSYSRRFNVKLGKKSEKEELPHNCSSISDAIQRAFTAYDGQSCEGPDIQPRHP